MTDDLIVHRLSRVETKTSPGPLISIVIPVYNRASLVSDAIESSLSQDYPYVEIVICDNSSSDGTLSTCLGFAGLHENITVASQPYNRGPVANWLACVKLAKGRLVKILFSDDILMPSCLSEMFSHLSPACGFVFSPCLVGERPSKSVILYESPFSGPIISARCALYDYAIFRRLPFSPCAALFRRSDVLHSLEQSIVDPSCEESVRTGAGPDVQIYLDVLLKYKYIARVARPLVFFRYHEGSFTVGKARYDVMHGYKVTLGRFFSHGSLALRIAASFHSLASYIVGLLSCFDR